MDVQVIRDEHPRRSRVGRHRLLDVAGEVGLGSRRADRGNNQFPGRHLEVADQSQRPVPLVLELDPCRLPRDHQLGRGGPLQRLNARHLVDADGVGILGPLQRRRRTVRVADRLDLLLKLHRVLLGGVQPIPALVGLQGGLAEVAAHLGRRDRRDDAPLDDLVGQFVGRPVGDGPARLRGGLAGDREDLGDLLRGELAGSARAGCVGEDRFDGPAQVGFGLAALQVNEAGPSFGPASSPPSDLASSQTNLCSDVFVAKAVKGQEDDCGPLPEMRGGSDGVSQREQDIVLTFRDRDLGRFTRHGENPPGVWEASKAG